MPCQLIALVILVIKKNIFSHVSHIILVTFVPKMCSLLYDYNQFCACCLM